LSRFFDQGPFDTDGLSSLVLWFGITVT
jgi:hypothetical protein